MLHEQAGGGLSTLLPCGEVLSQLPENKEETVSLEKAIEHGKERRRPYRGSRRFDRGCRNHGTCGWCEDNRTYANRRRLAAAEAKMNDYQKED